MAKKLYVGNLPFSCTDNDLMQAFGAYGEVASARVITDRETNRSKGFGFVEMVKDEEAATAIRELHSKPLNG
ncbi:MAG: RNA-binding protein, partial [Silvanigrellaceae bacterium]|nr:RNA-binding protein [Silvanigrellaceae bacterium]